MNFLRRQNTLNCVRDVRILAVRSPIGLRPISTAPPRLCPDTSRSSRVNWGIQNVPENTAYVIERLGNYSRTLTHGIHFLIPFVDRIGYVHRLDEQAIPITNQFITTADDVCIQTDGVLNVKIVDTELASYVMADSTDLTDLVCTIARTFVRREIHNITVDKFFKERDTLHEKIRVSVSGVVKDWGLECLGYEIRSISPLPEAQAAMDLSAEAEQKSRARVTLFEATATDIAAKVKGIAEALKETGDVEGAPVLRSSSASNYGKMLPQLNPALDGSSSETKSL